MTSVWQRVQAYCASILNRPDNERPEVWSSSAGLYRRRETREAAGETCEFALTHAFGPDDVVFEEGPGVTVNRSRSGMQLLLGVAPRCGQLLEVHFGSSALYRSVFLVEVRWTKPVREDVDGELHLVGCRLTFGPSRYWAF